MYSQFLFKFGDRNEATGDYLEKSRRRHLVDAVAAAVAARKRSQRKHELQERNGLYCLLHFTLKFFYFL